MITGRTHGRVSGLLRGEERATRNNGTSLPVPGSRRRCLGSPGKVWHHQGGMSSIHPLFFSIVIGSKPVLPCTEKRETVGCRVSCGEQNLTVSSAGGTAWLLTICIARNARAHTGRVPAAEVFSLIPDNSWRMAHTSETKESERIKHRDDTHWSVPGGVQADGAATLPTLVILGAGWFSRDFGRSVVIHPLARRNG